MNKKKDAMESPMVEEADVVKCIGILRETGGSSAAQQATAYKLALLLDMRNLLVRLTRDFEESLVA